VCKQTVTVPGKGTFTLSPDGKTTFVAVAGFYGTLTVQYRVTDGYGRFDTAPVTVEIVNPNPGSNEQESGSTQNGTTKGTTPVVLTPENPLPTGGQVCLIDPTDNVCKTVVKLPNVGTWTQAKDGSVKFVAVSGYVGRNTVMQRFTRASVVTKLTPYTVSVAKTRGPVTITISGFADGSPVLTAAIRAKINAFLRAHADYKNVFCIGYTEGPTVLKTDAALSKARAVNGCAFVKSGLGKTLTLKQLTASQGTVEAAKFRRITITLTD
jgi:flagellar motor protein MotB